MSSPSGLFSGNRSAGGTAAVGMSLNLRGCGCKKDKDIATCQAPGSKHGKKLTYVLPALLSAVQCNRLLSPVRVTFYTWLPLILQCGEPERKAHPPLIR